MFIAKLGTTVVGLEQKINSIDQSIYPNPSKGIFLFKDHENNKYVEVFNMLGDLVLTETNANQINLQDFPKGIYVARVNGTFVARLVKE